MEKLGDARREKKGKNGKVRVGDFQVKARVTSLACDFSAFRRGSHEVCQAITL